MQENKPTIGAQSQSDAAVRSNGPSGDVIVAMMAYLCDTADRSRSKRGSD